MRLINSRIRPRAVGRSVLRSSCGFKFCAVTAGGVNRVDAMSNLEVHHQRFRSHSGQDYRSRTSSRSALYAIPLSIAKELIVGAEPLAHFRSLRGPSLMRSVASDAAQSIALPSSALSKACQYGLTLWKKLTDS
jgi:hypothetical protein